MPYSTKPTGQVTHEAAPSKSPAGYKLWQIKLLYDGECPLCLREVDFLQKRDAGRGLVKFVDIAASDYEAADNAGIDFETAMGRIHAILPDGSIIQNVEVFRQVYDILGIGWIYAATGWPIVRPIIDWIYGVWADLRLVLTGRPRLETLVAQRRTAEACGDEQRCRMS